MLSDAGVELGSTYELPVVDEADSARDLAEACTMVEQSLPWDAPPVHVPYRQASIANRGPAYATPSDATPLTRWVPM